MQHSESMKAIAPALLAAQKATEFAKKDATNPHFKNKYADLPAVIEAVKPALNAAGIVYIQTASPSDDNRLHLTTMLMHESGEWISDTLVMPLPKQDPQGYGSAMTYARRYALAAITGVYQDDDDGNAASGAGSRPTQAQNDAQPTEAQATEADAMIVAQMNAAATVPDLVKLMNGLPADQKRLVTQHFNQRMSELKKAA
ncbi:ERF family protein [Achromobacter mucicolens]|uniref:ERF family protein n=1 Tax=Achromobacter mucicolens TaxID=1389922 RepID=UPI0028A8A02B|nr:ERF family protein [Achromobacter mucicolens]